jgi:hypothetical protein
MNALDYAGLTDPPRDIQDKEWTVNDHFRQLALRYLSSDWWHALRFLWFKTYAEEAYGIRVDVRCSSLCVALRSFRNRPCPTGITWWCCIA